MEYFGSSEELLSASQEALKAISQGAQMKLLEFSNLEWRKKRIEEREGLKAKGIRLLYKGQSDYPMHLNALCDAPMVLYTNECEKEGIEHCRDARHDFLRKKSH